MFMIAREDSKQNIFQAFEKIIADKKKTEANIATKEQEAEKAKNKQVLEVASTYTINSIVTGLADLQLEFGNIVNGLSEKLSEEVSKLEELKLAINIETQNLQELQEIRVVADALHILTQEHQENLKLLEQKHSQQQEELEKDIAHKHKLWGVEQEEFETTRQENHELLIRERQLQEADYQYELERQRKIETDQYEELKRDQQREQQTVNQEKEKQWAEREKIITERQSLFEEYQQTIETFPNQLDEAVKKAREEAIKEVHQNGKVKAELLEKDWEATKRGYEFKVQSLEEQIQKQATEIENLYNQLQDTLKQSQSLTLKAFENSSNINSKERDKD
ncbi:MAG: hypothetical protein F6K58_21960 [Symploca sp. SIO2E9]|nr:hypothetical protein [Symploca sp. SIO2E9]